MTNTGYNKIFGIGLNKTGTKTLHQCCEILGLIVTGGSRSLLCDVQLRGDFTRVFSAVEQYDVFQDWPWPLIYKELDRQFAHSKFILTVRKDAQTWVNSLKKWSLGTHPFLHCRKLAYGYNFPHRHEQDHLEFYQRHRQGVLDYFQGRDNDFIEICWESGDGWEKLCSFLGKDIPNQPIPHVNKGSEMKLKRQLYIPINTLLLQLGY